MQFVPPNQRAMADQQSIGFTSLESSPRQGIIRLLMMMLQGGASSGMQGQELPYPGMKPDLNQQGPNTPRLYPGFYPGSTSYPGQYGEPT